jgi:hypothetical protein
MNRISRVAHRLGVVLAVPLVAVAVVGAALNLKTRWEPPAPPQPDPSIDYSDRTKFTPVTDPKLIAELNAMVARDADNEKRERERRSNDGLFSLGLIGALGIGLYGVVRALGWIVNGLHQQ